MSARAKSRKDTLLEYRANYSGTANLGLMRDHSAACPIETSEALAARTASASAAVNCSVFAEWFIEQNFGPHMEQNAASLKPSSGRVSSCIARAVSGSSDNSNCRFQSKL